MELPNAEEHLMEIIWQNKQVFMKDILDNYEDPKPSPSTIATLLRRLQHKDYIDYEQFGNSRRYYAKVKKTDYFSSQINGLIKNFFDGSPLQFASFFTKKTNLTTTQLEELKLLIEEEIKNNSND